MIEQALQEECYHANMELPKLGLVDLTFGNVSVINRQAGLFAIKPSGVDYAKLRPGDIPLLNMEGRQVQGKLRPSSDTATHHRLFQAFPNIRAVVHSHSRNAVAFAQAGRAIPCFGTTHADFSYGEIPITRPMTPHEIHGQYELETGNVIIERFRNLNPDDFCAVLVHSHGPFVWGPTTPKTLENALGLEIIAEMAIKTLQINPNTPAIQKELLDKHFLRKHGTKAYYGQPGF